MRRPTPLHTAALTTLICVAACSTSSPSDSRAGAPPDSVIANAPATAVAPGPAPADSVLVVYKTPTCGCCKGWVEHMQQSGFAVEVHDMPDLTQVKQEAGVPEELRTCHTARIGGYVVEGHVPASDVRRLLAQRPAVKGVGTPGMPMGSPGMEGAFKDRYDVLTFGADGKTTVFASH